MHPAILWRRLDTEGHEAARLIERPSAWQLIGNAVFVSAGLPCRIDYRVTCDRGWATLGATVEGWLGDAPIDLSIEVDSKRRWWLNGAECPAVAGCLDLDLSFSPSTNLLPIRRLALAVGEEAPVRAAWLRFPELTLAPLEQCYLRLDDATYRYTSNGGRFVADLSVDDGGFVTSYPGLWETVTGRDRGVSERTVGDAVRAAAPTRDSA